MSEQTNTNSTYATASAQGQGASQNNQGGTSGGSSSTVRNPSSNQPTSGVASVNTGTRSATVTITETAEGEDEVLPLTLRARPSVRWDENVADNEGMGRKSSKRCCIFHKQRAFGESSTDSDYDSDRSGSSQNGGKGKRKIARPKNPDKDVPDFQRFHA